MKLLSTSQQKIILLFWIKGNKPQPSVQAASALPIFGSSLRAVRHGCIARSQEAFGKIPLCDVGALVRFARIVQWKSPNFSVARCFDHLCRAQQILDREGVIEATTYRYLPAARKPAEKTARPCRRVSREGGKPSGLPPLGENGFLPHRKRPGTPPSHRKMCKKGPRPWGRGPFKGRVLPPLTAPAPGAGGRGPSRCPGRSAAAKRRWPWRSGGSRKIPGRPRGGWGGGPAGSGAGAP